MLTGSSGQKLGWAQRIAAAIGVVKGIQFLHTGIVSGLYSNNLKITDILLDNNLNVKISSYTLPLLAENKMMVNGKKFCLYFIYSIFSRFWFSLSYVFAFKLSGRQWNIFPCSKRKCSSKVREHQFLIL